MILGTASKRRHELMRQFGIDFTIRHADIDETPQKNELPADLACRLAAQKGLALKCSQPVLTADTIVALGNECLGKPRDINDAKLMLRRLSGTVNVVHTAIALTIDEPDVCLVSSKVYFGELTDADIDLLAHDDCLDKSGSYGIQEAAGRYIIKIDGSFSSIMGLPLFETRMLLKKYQLIS